MEPSRLPQNNNHLFRSFMLCLLCASSLNSCDSNPPRDPVLLSSNTYSELEIAQAVSIEIEVNSQPVLIEILGRGTNYRSRIFNARQEVSSEVHLAFLRSAPVYHFIDTTSQRSSYTLEISPVQVTRLASVTINLYALSTGSKSDSALASAWRELGRGLQFVDSQAAEDWAENLAALNEARDSFGQLGLHEPALWAQYFKAYFEYYPLYRYSESLVAATALIQTAEQSDLPVLAMLGHQLAGQIRMERDAGNNEEQARLNYQQAQENFDTARQLADEQNNRFETIWAINNAGIAFNYQDQLDLSLQRYAEALNLAIDWEDDYLTALIGTNQAIAQQRLGHIDKALETLQRLQNELTMQSNPLEMENVLSLMGMDYLRLYQFPQALGALNRALELSTEHHWSENSGRNRLFLAQAYREMGQPEKSMGQLELAISDFEVAHDGRGLDRALALRADLNRLQQHFETMASDRARQEQYLATDADRAGWLASKARDAEAESNVEQAINLFRQSAELYATTPFPELGQLGILRACWLEAVRQRTPACSTEQLQAGHRQIQMMQASIPALEGKYLWAHLLADEGESEAARSVMTALIDDILFFRQSLPGVLGAWYLDARRELFDFHVQLLLDSGAAPEALAFDTLSVLDHLSNSDLDRTVIAPASTAVGSDTGSLEEFRLLLAQREQAKTTEAREAAQRGIDLWLLTSNKEGVGKASANSTGLREQLRQLPADLSILTFRFLEHQAFAWVGNAQSLSLVELGPGEPIQGLIKKANAGIRTFNHQTTQAEMARLGDLLIAPIQKQLRFTVLFLGAGELSDFPLEALVIEGEPMIRKHRVINILSAGGLDQVVAHLDRPFVPRQLFLAGNPDIESEGLQPLAGAARELSTIQQRFHNQDITLIQGEDLNRQALESAAFNTADLIHIASHATIDREYPELSRITLSSGAGNAVEFITPAELNYGPIAAQLVVLSACSTVGLNRFEYDSNLGFVSKFLQMGSEHVMASLWPVSDQATAEFLADFYAQQASGQDIASALRATKLKLLDAGPAGVNQWAAFQLFSQ